MVGTLQKCLPFFLKACFGILEVTVKGGQEQIRCFCQTFALRLKFNGETKVMHVHVLQVCNHNNILYFHTLVRGENFQEIVLSENTYFKSSFQC